MLEVNEKITINTWRFRPLQVQFIELEGGRGIIKSTHIYATNINTNELPLHPSRKCMKRNLWPGRK